ncbi:MAG: NUDIX hydrolase [Candidatus Dormibacteraeota bacterium]|nr:NUDIX hydrolase [Candidatus Dormibacteraeota bacterium]MDQ6920315.1 NUDIX hydrolase [Candidatus Dormibacteraeota bacterium]
MPSAKKVQTPPPGQEITIRAAGGVVGRSRRPGLVEVAVIHRRASGDWTLPKGRLNAGETPDQAALREVKEETGLRCQLLRALGCTDYLDARGRRKVACYWLMRRLNGRFQPSDEVDDLRWLSFGRAAALLSSERDRAVLRRAEVLGLMTGVWLSEQPLSRLA